jgi:hypothetical protein
MRKQGLQGLYSSEGAAWQRQMNLDQTHSTLLLTAVCLGPAVGVGVRVLRSSAPASLL